MLLLFIGQASSPAGEEMCMLGIQTAVIKDGNRIVVGDRPVDTRNLPFADNGQTQILVQFAGEIPQKWKVNPMTRGWRLDILGCQSMVTVSSLHVGHDPIDTIKVVQQNGNVALALRLLSPAELETEIVGEYLRLSLKKTGATYEEKKVALLPVGSDLKTARPALTNVSAGHQEGFIALELKLSSPPLDFKTIRASRQLLIDLPGFGNGSGRSMFEINNPLLEVVRIVEGQDGIRVIACMTGSFKSRVSQIDGSIKVMIEPAVPDDVSRLEKAKKMSPVPLGKVTEFKEIASVEGEEILTNMEQIEELTKKIRSRIANETENEANTLKNIEWVKVSRGEEIILITNEPPEYEIVHQDEFQVTLRLSDIVREMDEGVRLFYGEFLKLVRVVSNDEGVDLAFSFSRPSKLEIRPEGRFLVASVLPLVAEGEESFVPETSASRLMVEKAIKSLRSDHSDVAATVADQKDSVAAASGDRNTLLELNVFEEPGRGVIVLHLEKPAEFKYVVRNKQLILTLSSTSHGGESSTQVINKDLLKFVRSYNRAGGLGVLAVFDRPVECDVRGEGTKLVLAYHEKGTAGPVGDLMTRIPLIDSLSALPEKAEPGPGEKSSDDTVERIKKIKDRLMAVVEKSEKDAEEEEPLDEVIELEIIEKVQEIEVLEDKIPDVEPEEEVTLEKLIIEEEIKEIKERLRFLEKPEHSTETVVEKPAALKPDLSGIPVIPVLPVGEEADTPVVPLEKIVLEEPETAIEPELEIVEIEKLPEVEEAAKEPAVEEAALGEPEHPLVEEPSVTVITGVEVKEQDGGVILKVNTTGTPVYRLIQTPRQLILDFEGIEERIEEDVIPVQQHGIKLVRVFPVPTGARAIVALQRAMKLNEEEVSSNGLRVSLKFTEKTLEEKLRISAEEMFVEEGKEVSGEGEEPEIESEEMMFEDELSLEEMDGTGELPDIGKLSETEELPEIIESDKPEEEKPETGELSSRVRGLIDRMKADRERSTKVDSEPVEDDSSDTVGDLIVEEEEPEPVIDGTALMDVSFVELKGHHQVVLKLNRPATYHIIKTPKQIILNLEKVKSALKGMTKLIFKPPVKVIRTNPSGNDLRVIVVLTRSIRSTLYQREASLVLDLVTEEPPKPLIEAESSPDLAMPHIGFEPVRAVGTTMTMPVLEEKPVSGTAPTGFRPTMDGQPIVESWDREADYVSSEGIKRALSIARQREKSYMLYIAGEAAAERGDWAEAMAKFRQALEITPGDLNVIRALNTAVPKARVLNLYQRGREYQKSKEIYKAIWAYREGLKLDPVNVQLKYALKEAEKEEQVLLHLDQGRNYYLRKNYEKAVPQLKQAVEKDPNNATSYHYLGLCYMNLKWFKAAVAELGTALKLAPYDKDVRTALEEARQRERIQELYRLGQTHEKNGKWDLAVKYYEDALNLERGLDTDQSTVADTFLKEGLRHFNQKEFRKAIASFREVLKVAPQNLKANYWLGRSLMVTGEISRAVAAFKRVVELDPSNSISIEELLAVAGDDAKTFKKLGL